MRNFFSEKVAQNTYRAAYYIAFNKVNNSLIGEMSPNVVTLAVG
jgi:hypothetical protein